MPSIILVAAMVAQSVTAQSASPVQVDAFAGASHIQCSADQMQFPVSVPQRFVWRCIPTGVRYQCRLTTSAVLDLGINYVILNCTELTVLPADGVFTNSFE